MRSSPAPRRARIAATLAFATNGALPASLLARYAEVKTELGVDAALFGLLVAGYAVGGMLALHLPGVISRRLGVTRAAVLGTVWIGAAFVLAAAGAATGQPWLFLLGLVLAGCGDAVVDVAQNSQGIRVQKAYGRSLLNTMHAGWSIGAAIGGGVGTAAAIAGLPLLVHMGLWAAFCILMMSLAARAFLREPRPDAAPAPAPGNVPPPQPLRGRMVLVLLPLALIALAGVSVEDIGNNWSAILLATERDLPVTSAGIGLSVLLGAQFIGRLLGDRLIDVLGDRRALALSLTAVIAGLSCAAWAPNAALTLAGLALAGLGSAITVPIAFARADAVPSLPAHSGVTWISWTMRTASIGLSPVIGVLSAVLSLPVALTAVVMLAVLALLFSLPRRT
ncbi:MFS transporter [Sediminivirga luteola]|jgi:MFS family permease|uniref:MFS transporter n=1 Tax=Sediminivirga luteola TaxID=1774748 RepID=A0A8J2TVN3_9MICO|nr:MFS transporter [Sediminivirga luteola]GGA03725.1 MFS transporter [Sediminivirga luteola]